MFRKYGIGMLALIMGVFMASFTVERSKPVNPKTVYYFTYSNGTGGISNPNNYTKADPQPPEDSDVCPGENTICGIWIEGNGATPERPANLSTFVSTHAGTDGVYDGQVTGEVDFQQ